MWYVDFGNYALDSGSLLHFTLARSNLNSIIKAFVRHLFRDPVPSRFTRIAYSGDWLASNNNDIIIILHIYVAPIGYIQCQLDMYMYGMPSQQLSHIWIFPIDRIGLIIRNEPYQLSGREAFWSELRWITYVPYSLWINREGKNKSRTRFI